MSTGVISDTLAELSRTIEQINIVNDLIVNTGCVDGAIIGTGRSDYTQESTQYDMRIRDKAFALIDIPGIEGDEKDFEDTIKKSLEQAHAILYVNGAGKKIEKESLEKIKKYLHDGTSVYAIFNTHCFPKRERKEGTDKTYSEELEEAYRRQEDIIKQTESELYSFLGENYKGSINMNGLLAFCSVAFDSQHNSTIKNESDKTLRKEQEKYLKEYCSNTALMLESSRLSVLMNTIERKVDSYDKDIVEENIKKLKNRMSELLDTITTLKNNETRTIDGFIKIYDEFEINCTRARDIYLDTLSHIARNVVTESFYSLMEELYKKVDDKKGKVSQNEIKLIVESRREEVAGEIQRNMNRGIIQAQKKFLEAIQDAQERLKKDFERELVGFEVALSTESIYFTASLSDLKFDFSNFGKEVLLKIEEYVFKGELENYFSPGLAVVAAIEVGVSILIKLLKNIVLSKQKRIDKAKERIKQDIDDRIDEITEKLNMDLKKAKYEDAINKIHDDLFDESERNKNTLRRVKQLIINVESELFEIQSSIA